MSTVETVGSLVEPRTGRAATAKSVSQHAHLRAAQIFHWLTAIIVGVMISTGVAMKQLGDAPYGGEIVTFHKTAGFALLCLVGVRLGFRIAMRLAGKWRRGAGMHPVHFVLYAMLIAVPLLGLAGISDFGARTIYFGLSLPEVWPYGAGYADILFRSHAILAFSLLALVSVHIGIALGDYVHRGTLRRTGPDDEDG